VGSARRCGKSGEGEAIGLGIELNLFLFHWVGIFCAFLRFLSLLVHFSDFRFSLHFRISALDMVKAHDQRPRVVSLFEPMRYGYASQTDLRVIHRYLQAQDYSPRYESQPRFFPSYSLHTRSRYWPRLEEKVVISLQHQHHPFIYTVSMLLSSFLM